MRSEEAVIYIIDDDTRLLEALESLLRSTGRRAVTFARARDFLTYQRSDEPSCIILDLNMPEINGLELQAALSLTEAPPIIFLTGSADVPSAVRALKAGAADFLSKPFDETELLERIDHALERDQRNRVEFAEVKRLKELYATLTPRECDVLPYLVSGYLNKQTASELGTSEITIRIHRGKVMRKMQADSLTDLVRIATRLAIRQLPPYR